MLKKEKFYASNIFLGQFFSQIYINIDKILVGVFLTPTALGSLEVLTKLPILINKFLGLSVSTIIPMVGSTQSDQLDKFSKELFHKGFRWYSSFITPIILALMFYSEEFLFIWIGSEVSDLHDILSLILLWCLLTTLSFGGNIVYGREEGIKEMTIYRILQSLLKVLAIYFFIQDYGLYAVAMSYLISNLSLIYVIGVFRRYISIDVKAFLGEFIKILLCSFPSLILGLILTNFFNIGNFLSFLIAFLLWQIPYWIMLYYVVLQKEDKIRLKSILYS
jgi:O-antigen/teichoic acid export membrane protein